MPLFASGDDSVAQMVESYQESDGCAKDVPSKILAKWSKFFKDDTNGLPRHIAKTLLVTELFEQLRKRGDSLNDSVILKKYTLLNQSSTLGFISDILKLNSASEKFLACAMSLESELRLELLGRSMDLDTRQSHSQFIAQIASAEKGLENESTIHRIEEVVKFEKEAFDFIGYESWKPMRVYLQYTKPSITRNVKPFFQNIKFYCALLRLRMLTVEALIPDRMQRLMLTSAIVEHFGFVLLTSELFRQRQYYLFPGEAGGKAERFAFAYLSVDSDWYFFLLNLYYVCESDRKTLLRSQRKIVMEDLSAEENLRGMIEVNSKKWSARVPLILQTVGTGIGTVALSFLLAGKTTSLLASFPAIVASGAIPYVNIALFSIAAWQFTRNSYRLVKNKYRESIRLSQKETILGETLQCSAIKNTNSVTITLNIGRKLSKHMLYLTALILGILVGALFAFFRRYQHTSTED